MQTQLPLQSFRPTLAAAIQKSSITPKFPEVGSDPSVGQVYFNDGHGSHGGMFNIKGLFGMSAPSQPPAAPHPGPPPGHGQPPGHAPPGQPGGMYSAGPPQGPQPFAAAPAGPAPVVVSEEDKDREIDRLRKEVKKAEEKSSFYRNQVMALQQQVSSMDNNAPRMGDSPPNLSEVEKLRLEVQEERSRSHILQVQLQERGTQGLANQRHDSSALAALQARISDLEGEIRQARTMEAPRSLAGPSQAGAAGGYLQPSPLNGTMPNCRPDPLDPSRSPGSSKRAVIVGCDYPGQQGSLRAGVADAQQWARFFTKRCNFAETDIRLLSDDPAHYQQKERPDSALASRANMLRALNWLTARSSSGDQLFFVFCGFGVQVLAEEFAGRKLCENAMASTDVSQDGAQPRVVSDTDMHQALQAVPSGAQATLIYDCCHAGTPLDRAGLNYLTEYVNRGKVDYDKLKGHPVLPRFLELQQWKVRPNPPEAVRESNLRCQAVQWSACTNEQFCVELPIDERPRGVFTYIFICALLKIGVNATSNQLLQEITTLTAQLKGRWRLQQEAKLAMCRSTGESQHFLKM